MNSRSGHSLLGDIGGTNARFAFLADGRIGPVETLAVKDYPSFAAALSAFLSRRRRQEAIRSALLAVAGPVENSHCELSNSSWVVDAEELRNTFNFASVRILNDFEAIAWSLPALAPSDLIKIGRGRGPRRESFGGARSGHRLGTRVLRAAIRWIDCYRRRRRPCDIARRLSARRRDYRPASRAIWTCLGGTGSIGQRARQPLSSDRVNRPRAA